MIVSGYLNQNCGPIVVGSVRTRSPPQRAEHLALKDLGRMGERDTIKHFLVYLEIRASLNVVSAHRRTN